jgi:hypothetical protein
MERKNKPQKVELKIIQRVIALWVLHTIMNQPIITAGTASGAILTRIQTARFGGMTSCWMKDPVDFSIGSPGKIPMLSRADFNCPGSGKMMLNGKAYDKDEEDKIRGDVDLDKTNRPEFADEWDLYH